MVVRKISAMNKKSYFSYVHCFMLIYFSICILAWLQQDCGRISIKRRILRWGTY